MERHAVEVVCKEQTDIINIELMAFNVTFASGIYCRSAAELLSAPLPVGGTNRLQAGGSVVVVRRGRRPSLHAVSSHPVVRD